MLYAAHEGRLFKAGAKVTLGRFFNHALSKDFPKFLLALLGGFWRKAVRRPEGFAFAQKASPFGKDGLAKNSFGEMKNFRRRPKAFSKKHDRPKAQPRPFSSTIKKRETDRQSRFRALQKFGNRGASSKFPAHIFHEEIVLPDDSTTVTS